MSCWDPHDLRHESVDIQEHGAVVTGVLDDKLYRTYGYVGFMALIFLTMLPPSFLFIKDYCQKHATERTRSTKVLFRIGLLFIFISICCIGGSIVARLMAFNTLCEYALCIKNTQSSLHDFCLDDAIFNFDLIFYSISIIYLFQTLLVQIILFLRCYFIFQGSVFAMEPRVVGQFKMVFTCYPIMSLLLLILLMPFKYMIQMKVITFLSTIVNTMVTLKLTKHFLKSLSVLCNKHYDPKLLKLMTKTTTLQIISSISFFLLPIFDTLWSVFIADEFYWFFLIHISVSVDMYINFFCIMMSYSFLDPLYRKLCGCVHDRFGLCWFDRHTPNRKRTLEMMQDASVRPQATFEQI